MANELLVGTVLDGVRLSGRGIIDMSERAQRRRIGVATDDDAVALVVAARLGLAGFEPIRAHPGAPLARGVIAICPATDAADALTWQPEPDAAPTLEAIVAEATRRWPSESPAAPWEPGPMRLRVAEILAALGRLRPDLKLVLETPRGTLGLCSVAGRIVSAGLEGEPLGASPSVAADPSLSLVMDLAALGDGPSARARLHAELGLVCEYAELFAASRGYGEHLVRIAGATLALPVGAIHVEPHAPCDFGADVFEVLARALARAAPETRRALLPTGPLDAGDGLPRWLRGSLPPQRFGRLFFALEGVPLDEAVSASRLDPAEAEAAVALGVLAGVVYATGPRAAPQDFARPTPPVTPPSAASPEPPPLPADACGAPTHFFDLVRHAAEDDRKTGKRRRLGGTRFEPAGDRVDDLLLYFRIGAGATGDVFLGVQGGDGGFQKTVAVKRLADVHGAEGRWRDGFLAEARFAASLEHPNLVQIFRLLERQGRHHIVMEFVHGASVAQLVAALGRAGTPCPESVVRWVGAEAARGLHYMHERPAPDGGRIGLIHRDVAPPNILVAFDGSVRLIDLSIAQPRNDHSPARVKTMSGRLGYVSPETLVGIHATPSSDLFGLAATLYELLVGAPCFLRGTPHTTLDAIAAGAFAPILKARPDVSPRLAYAIERGLAVNPDARFKDLAAFREALLRDGPEPDPAGRSEALLLSLFGEVRTRERDTIERMRRSAVDLFARR